MKKLIALFAVAILLISFQSQQKVRVHYPDFMMKMVFERRSYPDSFPVSYTVKAYKNGTLVKGCNDYLENIDSVSVVDFYSRIGKYQWKKYNADKKLIDTITEYRNDTIVDPYEYDFGTKVYYKVH